jgi:hypothetical protein
MMSGQTVIPVRQRPLVSVTSITSVAGGAIDISGGLDLDKNAGLIRRPLGYPFYGPFFMWLPGVNVTYVAGWGVAVPAAFNSAARIILQHLWETQHGGADHHRAFVGKPARPQLSAVDRRGGIGDGARIRVRHPAASRRIARRQPERYSVPG